MTKTTTRPVKRPVRKAREATGKRAARPRRPAADPRIEARRRDVARSEGRKRLRLLIALASITLASIGCLVALQSSWLDIEEIVVAGAKETDPDVVRSASAIELGSPLVDLDLVATEEAVEALPWVDTVEVARAWSGTVTVMVTERVPAIALPASEGFMLVDAAGRQLGPVPDRPAWADLINGLVVSGVPGQPAPTEVHGVIRLLSLLTAEQRDDIASISVVDRHLILDLTNGGQVDLGNESGLPEKLVSYDTIRAGVDLRCLHRIDLRVPTAPAITRVSAVGETGQALSDLSNCT